MKGLFRKLLNKIIPAFITALMIAAHIPPGALVLANTQEPIRGNEPNPAITVGAKSGAQYNLTFRWDRPPNNDLNFQNPSGSLNENEPGQTVYHLTGKEGGAGNREGDGSAYFYDLRYSRNSTNNFINVPGFLEHPSNKGVGGRETLSGNFNLEPGSMYAFELVPYHFVETITRTMDQYNVITSTTSISAHRTETGNQRALFFTDIRVNALIDDDGQLVVSFDRTMLDGRSYFSSWEIDITTTEDVNFLNPVYVHRVNDNGTSPLVTAVIPSTFNLQAQTPYIIRVEPMINNGRVRTQANTGLYHSNTDVMYKYDGIIMKTVSLSWQDYDANNIMLAWDKLTNVSKIKMYASPDIAVLESYKGPPKGTVVPPLIFERSGSTAGSMTTYPTARPNRTMHYMLEYEYQGSTFFSNITTYSPSGQTFQPTKPVIREATHVANPNLRLNITWDAFLRDALTLQEQDTTAPMVPHTSHIINRPANPRIHGKYYDTAIAYDVYVTDALQPLLDFAVTPNMAYGNGKIRPSALTLRREETEPGIDPRLDYTFTFPTGITQYWSYNGATPTLVNGIHENKVYYFMVVAWQVDSAGQVTSSAPAMSYYSYFVPGQDILTRPNMMSKPPLRIKQLEQTDENGNTTFVDDIGVNHITVQWDTMYFEAYNTAANDNRWYTRVGYDTATGQFVFGDNIRPNHKYIDLIPSVVGVPPDSTLPRSAELYMMDPANGVYKRIKDAFGLTSVDTNELRLRLPLRFVNFQYPPPPSDFALNWINYDVMRTTYETMENYIAQFLKDALTSANWPGVVVENTGQVTMEYRIEELEAGTSYLMALWPYIDNDFFAHEPANIVASTLNEPVLIEVTPNVPVLEPRPPEGPTDLTVGWFYDSRIGYELYVSELQADYPNETNNFVNNGFLINDEYIRLLGMESVRYNPLTGANEPYMEFTIDGLFPETTYYFWIRAYAVSPISGNTLYSGYSNFINMRTTELPPPLPPTGFYLIGEDHMDIINKYRNDGVLHNPVDIDYMYLEWLRITDDQGYSGDFLESPLLVHDSDITWESVYSYIARFTDLKPNTSYYARVKTVLTVTRNEPFRLGATNPTSKEYQYVVQLSLTEEFEEYVEITVPPTIEGGASGSRFIQKESEWTRTIRIYTATWDGEYTGNIDPNTYPMPEDDYEITFDAVTNTLTYRFRSNQVDLAGWRDNGADMRFINRLIHSGTYDFTVDLSEYRSIVPRRRVVELPFSVYSAMADRFIGLTIKAGRTTYTLPAQFLNMPEVWAMTGFGYGAVIRIVMEDNPADAPRLPHEFQYFAAGPCKLTVQVTAGSNRVNLVRTVLPITVTQHALNRGHILSGNTSAFRATLSGQMWEAADFTIDSSALSVSQHTYDICTYAVIGRQEAMITVDNPEAADVLASVNRTISFDNLIYYNPYATVSSGWLNKLTAAIAAGTRSVDLDAPLTADERNALTKSGFMVTDNESVTRQVAISQLVKLYELKTQTQIRDHSSLAQTIHLDIALADAEYQPWLLKAVDLGFFENRPSAVRPMDMITMEELLAILNLIVLYTK